MKKHFSETQKFTQWWLWLLLIICFALPIYSYFSNPSKPMNDTSFIISMSILSIVFVMFFLLKLKTEVNEQGISYSYFPFIRKRQFLWSEIESAKVINYGFVGGWGIRMSIKYGTIYNVKGKMGLQITLKSGKKFVLGTQKHEELLAVLEQYKY
ncbi:MAG: hypothetical protein KDE33_17540 [Bacteroidetes bacterium]|nr:hypothetical protein [Bacteroidota bacterium]MCB9227545.1 hypothetical protein [Chitinophagales bacterium]